MASASVTDHRIKKLATISGMMAADGFQFALEEIPDEKVERQLRKYYRKLVKNHLQ